MPVAALTTWLLVVAVGALVAVAAVTYVLAATGRLTVDVGLGRRVRPLGPHVVRIAASPERVFDLVTVPYLSGQPPRELREKVRVLERSDGMVLAAHRTRIGPLTVVTVETVTFEPPHRVGFRLVRGPVPYAVEQFVLREVDGETELEYTGELGADLWLLGRAWAAGVAWNWERAVSGALAGFKASAEEQERRRAARA